MKPDACESNATTRPDSNPLVPHLATLAQQASEQTSDLSTALDTLLFLDSMVTPENTGDRENLFPSIPQLMVLKQALNTELQRQVKALTRTTDALCVCAATVGDTHRSWPTENGTCQSSGRAV